MSISAAFLFAWIAPLILAASLPPCQRMKLELYIDATGKGDRFEKVLEYEDRGQWGPTIGGNSVCHCGENVVLTMARVAIGYRCDDLKDFQFKDMSIRSIDPVKPLHW